MRPMRHWTQGYRFHVYDEALDSSLEIRISHVSATAYAGYVVAAETSRGRSALGRWVEAPRSSTRIYDRSWNPVPMGN